MFRLTMLLELQALWGTLQSIGAVGIVLEDLVLKYLVIRYYVGLDETSYEPSADQTNRPKAGIRDAGVETWPGFS